MMAQNFIQKRLGFLLNTSKPELIRAGAFASVSALLCVGFSSYFGLFIDISEIRCLPEVVYVGYPRPENLSRGDVVSFVASRHLMFGAFNGHRIAKIVVAMAGDSVHSDESGVTVNGKKIAERNPHTLERMQVRGFTPLNMDRVLKPGELFVMGVMPRSFDSRYWGVVQDRAVDRLVKPLL